MTEQDERKSVEEKQFFQLVQAVGTSGRYQSLIMVLAVLICIQNGIISLGTSYVFAIAPYS